MKLLLTGAFKYTSYQLEKIKSLGFDIQFIQEERAKINIDVSDIDAVVCNNLFLYNDISLFKNLKFIQLTSAGYDRVPLEYIKENNILIFNARGVYSIPIAEFVVMRILEIYKKSFLFYENQKIKKWEKQRNLLELYGKNVLILGYGEIGSEIAKRLKPFGVKIFASKNNYENSELVEIIKPHQVKSYLNYIDIVISTLPLTITTKNLINKEFLSKMKSNSLLINVSRGDIINEKDLIQISMRKKFLGIVLDVFNKEPLPLDNPLWSLPNVLITPHNSYVSDNINKRLFEKIYNNLKTLI